MLVRKNRIYEVKTYLHIQFQGTILNNANAFERIKNYSMFPKTCKLNAKSDVRVNEP
jgi:hypothetical protein